MDAEVSGAVPAARVASALRRLRPQHLRIESVGPDTCVTLVMQASDAARRNAAAHVVSALERDGLRLAATDPVAELARPGTALAVRHPGA